MESMLIPHRISEQARRRPTHPAYFTKEKGDWKATDWKGYAAQIRQAGKAMIALGVEPGRTVCILGFTRPEWVIFDVACMTIGGVPAGIYTTNSPVECEYILDHAEASSLLIENGAKFHKVKKSRDRLSSLKYIIAMKGTPPLNDPQVMSWAASLQKGDGINDAEFECRMAAIQPDQVATLIYTSGTKGPPKGVMLWHANIAWIGRVMVEVSDWDRNERTLSHLPLSHIAEQNMSIYAPATGGPT